MLALDTGSVYDLPAPNKREKYAHRIFALLEPGSRIEELTSHSRDTLEIPANYAQPSRQKSKPGQTSSKSHSRRGTKACDRKTHWTFRSTRSFSKWPWKKPTRPNSKSRATPTIRRAATQRPMLA